MSKSLLWRIAQDISVALLAASTLLLGLALFTEYYEEDESSYWIPTKATIGSEPSYGEDIYRDPPRNYSFGFVYEYDTPKGHYHIGAFRYPNRLRYTESEAEKLLGRYSKGDVITVYYDPDNHDTATVIRTRSLFSQIGFVAAPAFLAIFIIRFGAFRNFHPMLSRLHQEVFPWIWIILSVSGLAFSAVLAAQFLGIYTKEIGSFCGTVRMAVSQQMFIHNVFFIMLTSTCLIMAWPQRNLRFTAVSLIAGVMGIAGVEYFVRII